MRVFGKIYFGYNAINSFFFVWVIFVIVTSILEANKCLISRKLWFHSSVQFSLVAQSFLTLCDPMNCSTAGLQVHHQPPESTQTYIHRVGNTIQPSHPLSSPFPPTLNLSQHQVFFPICQLFASGGQNIGASASASVLPMNIQDWFPLAWTGLISLQSKGLSRVFSSTTVQKHQFFSAQPSLWSNCHICTWLLEKP